MRFNSDGKFKIMQITDIQEIPDVSPDTIKLINAALEEEKPDLVVLTGDQIKGYGVSYKGKGEHYKIDETKCVEGSVLLEPPSIPDINTGEFEALSEKGDVLGVYVGHDHKNSYVGKVGNIDVGFTQSAGFNVYGNGKQRGVRCFVLDENDPRKYKTYTKTYEQLCDGKLNTPIKDAIWRVVPTTVDMAKPMMAKALAALAAVVALIVIAVKFL